MNHRHRFPRASRRILAALAGAAAIAAGTLPALVTPTAEAQTLDEGSCATIAQQIEAIRNGSGVATARDAVASALGENVYEPLCVDDAPVTPPTLPSVGLACSSIDSIDRTVEDHPDLDQASKDAIRDQIADLRATLNCPPPTSSTSSTTTTTAPGVPPGQQGPLVESRDGQVREVARLRYEPLRSGDNTGRSAVVLDTDARIGYRIYAGLQADEGPRVHTFSLETLRDGISRSYDFFLNLPASSSNAGLGTDILTAVGQGADGRPKLFVRDKASRIHVIDGPTLEREGSFAPPLPRSALPVDNAVGVPGDALQSLEEGRTPTGPLSTIQALAYLPPKGAVENPKLLAYIESSIPEVSGPSFNFVAQYDVATGREDWATRVSGCASKQTSSAHRYGAALAVAPTPDGGRDLLLGCYSTNGRGEVWTIGLTPDGTGLGAEAQVGILPSTVGFLSDPAGGRMSSFSSFGTGQFVIGVNARRPEAPIYGAAQATANALDSIGVGIDPQTGRVYGFAQSTDVGDGDVGGLVMVDGRRQPLPQRFAYPELNPLGQRGRDRISVDPARGSRPARIFVPIADEPSMVRIFEDVRPVVGNQKLTEADRFTNDVEEDEGKTRVSTTATTSAYGVRVWLTGGLYHYLPNDTPWPSLLKNSNAGVFPACEPHNRELVLAEIKPGGTTLSNAGLNGSAVAARVDERTRQDLSRPSSACWPTQGIFSTHDGLAKTVNDIAGGGTAPARDVYDQIKDTPVSVPSSDPDDEGTTVAGLLGIDGLSERPAPSWPSGPDSRIDASWQSTFPDPFPMYAAICSAPGETGVRPLADGHADAGEDDVALDVVGTEVSPGPAPGFAALAACGDDGRTVVTHARAAGPLGSESAITFQGTETTSTMRWKDGGGVVVVTSAAVRGVDIAGLLRIGEVRTVAVAEAAGRTHSARGRIRREWCAVVGLGEQGDKRGCQDVDDPEFQARLSQFNDNVLSRRGLEVRVTPLDAELAAGTPGGALAGVQKDRFLVAGESFLNNDERSNVAALELVEVSDTASTRARHLYQLAGVEASTSYNISLIPQFGFQPLGLPTFSGPGGLPPSASEVLAAADRRTTQRVLTDPASASAGASSPPGGGGLLQAVRNGLRWLLRNPFETLKFTMLLFTAWALPLHLHEKRRMLATATLEGT